MPSDPPAPRHDATRASSALARRALRLLRDAWVIVGLALALMVGLELAYRAQGALRRRPVSVAHLPGVPAAPPSSAAWYAEWKREQDDAVNHTRWDPHRGWWPRPYASRYVNVDSLGRRVTPQSVPVGAPRRVLLLGGSTMWGYTARDSFTIPALVASALLRGGVHDIEIVNLAQPAFTSTQAAITLLLELRRGERPMAVVFLDGGNDVATAYQSGVPGAVFNEGRAAERWERGGRTPGDGLRALASHLTLLTRLSGRGTGSSPAASDSARKHLCGAVAEQYVQNAQSIQAIGRDRGFVTLFLWQPLLATTKKQTTPAEDSVADFPGYGVMLQRCSALVDSLAPPRLGGDFAQLAGLFDEERGTVFLDNAGHVTEQANGIVAERIATLLLDRLGR